MCTCANAGRTEDADDNIVRAVYKMHPSHRRLLRPIVPAQSPRVQALLRCVVFSGITEKNAVVCNQETVKAVHPPPSKALSQSLISSL